MKVVINIVRRVSVVLNNYIRRHLRAALLYRQKLPLREELWNLLLAVLIGMLGGISNLIFHSCEELIKVYALGHHGEITEIARTLDWWQRLIAPAIGAFIAGGLLWMGMRVAEGKQPPGFLEVVVSGDGKLPFRLGIIRTISSLMSLGTGSSIGREGSIVNLSATVASKVGQLLSLQPYRLRLLTACGAASGLAAAFNAPLAGAIFASQVVLGNFSMNLFAPVVFSSVIASIMSRSFFGIEPLYRVPVFEFTRLGQLPWLLIVGIGSGIIGAVFLKGLHFGRELFQKLNCQIYVKMAIGGLAVGALAIQYPWVWGNGYGATNKILYEDLEFSFLISLFLAKILATIISVGSGAVGGIMTPSLFTGAAFGSSCGIILHTLGFAQNLPVCVFTLAGMGSLFSATTHSPLLAMVMVFEISLNYSLMPALMFTCPLATLIAKVLHRDSVYTEELRRIGYRPEDSKKIGSATVQTVADIMRKPVPPLSETAPFEDVVQRFLSSTYNHIPVVGKNNRLSGVISLQDVKEYLNNHEGISGVIAYDIMRPVSVYLTPEQNLMEVLPVLLRSDIRNIPVVNNPEEQILIGSVVQSEALGILSEAISARTLR